MKPLLLIWLREGSKVIKRYYEFNLNYVVAKVEMTNDLIIMWIDYEKSSFWKNNIRY